MQCMFAITVNNMHNMQNTGMTLSTLRIQFVDCEILIYILTKLLMTITMNIADHKRLREIRFLMRSLLSVFLSQSWLRQYGYLPQASKQMSTMRSTQILLNAISDMQRFYGLEITGVLDHGTIE